MTDNFDTRSEYLGRLRSQLFGPIDGEDEVWLFYTEKPHKQYTLGILYPRINNSVGLMVDEFDEQGASISDSDEVDDSPLASMLQKRPASAGMTFAVEDKSNIKIQISAAKYKIKENFPTEGKVVSKVYKRAQLEDSVVKYQHSAKKEIDVIKELVLEDEAELRIRSRKIGNSQVVTIAVINACVIEEELWTNSEDCLFQLGVSVTCSTGQFIEPPSPKTAFDNEEEELRLRYRNQTPWATGHATSVGWELDSNGLKPEKIYIDFMPEVDVYQFIAEARSDATYDMKVLSIKFLAEVNDPLELRKHLTHFIDDLKSWRLEKNKIDCGFVHADALEKVLKNLLEQEKRLHSGIGVLCDPEHPSRLKSFNLANLAMLDQMERAALNNDPLSTFDRSLAAWRPFQLAFQLLGIPGIINDKDSDRDLVDLIWFPTGGGKTEAYLLLAAFTIIWRRSNYKAAGLGTAVITRYTLRLLTTQQFERAAILTCALERLRKQGLIYGEEEITIGLWIGGTNTLKAARDLYDDKIRCDPPINPFMLLNCPWCNERIVPKTRSELDPIGVHIDANTLKFNCPKDSCEFHAGLPVQVIDQCLYAKPPTILLGTIDKFAILPWKNEARTLFGIGCANRPPDLIIQDELHLISGPLGTIAAIYEAGIDVLCAGEEYDLPKVVASTATIRGAEMQARRLYGREVSIFPSPGPDFNDSFYMELDQSSSALSRRYVGIMGQGQSPITSKIHVAAAMIDTAKHVTDGDLYWTLVCYHNSKRELGKTITLCKDDIPARIKYLNGTDHYRLCEQVKELSANVETHLVPDVLKQMSLKRGDELAIDVLPCTSMISVGVDVARLNAMLIDGQPKTSSEYIQASSRVGRSSQGGGVVVALFSPVKPRDRSHYESFPIFHESIYRWVEPTSVTPYSKPALDRALHAAVIMAVRLILHPMNDHAALLDISSDEFRKILDRLKDRLRRAVPEEREFANVEQELDAIIEWWNERKEDPGLRYKDEPNFPGLLRGFTSGNDIDSEAKKTLYSMRHVDGEVATKVMFQKTQGANNG